MMIFAFDRVKNIVGKEEDAGYQIFFFSHDVFKRVFTQGRQKSGLCGKELTSIFFFSNNVFKNAFLRVVKPLDSKGNSYVNHCMKKVISKYERQLVKNTGNIRL